MLHLQDLWKGFGEKEVLKGLTLHVPEHSIYGFIGQNGAGKTTCMRLILGLLTADQGSITVAGTPVRYGNTSSAIGFLPDVPEFYNFMTAREYLKLCGEITGLSGPEIRKRSEDMLELVGLSEEKHRIKGYSRGMKQRLGIAQALLGKPRLLICDEPTSALDPVGRKEILDVLKNAATETTVLFSTHILTDVERICTDVAFLHEGKIRLEGSLSEIKSRYIRDSYRVELADTVMTVSASDIHPVLQTIAAEKREILKIERQEPDLESVFMEVIQS